MSSLAAIFVMVTSLIEGIGWYIENDLYQDLVHRFISVTPGSVIGMGIAALSLWLQGSQWLAGRARPHRWALAAGRVLGCLLAGLGVLAALIHVPGPDATIFGIFDLLHVDTRLIRSNAMAPLSALGFVLAGVSLLLLDRADRKGRYTAEYCAIVLACTMVVPVVAYVYNATSTVQVIPSLTFPIQTPLLFLLLAVGILCARPQHQLMAIFLSDAPGGHLLRRLLPMTLLLLIILDLVAEWGASQGFYEHAKISPLIILVDSGVLFILFWRAAFLLNHEYVVRRQGEEALAKSNALLRVVSDSTTDPIFVKDRAGRMIFANPATLKVIGREIAAVLGHTSAELFSHPEDVVAMETNDQIVINSRKAHAFEQVVHGTQGVRIFYVTKAPWTSEKNEVLGIVGIATDITERKRTEEALKAHETQLEALVLARTAEVRELIGHLEATREEEKRAIARELHDDLGSTLTALNMHLAIIFQQLSGDAKITERAVKVKALLNSITATTRRIQNGLRPDKLDVFGLKAAIADQVQEFENYTGLTCRTSLPDEDLSYDSQMEITLFRMVQEALNNIAKHAKATRVDVILDDNDEEVMLTILDDGIGISAGMNQGSKHGLRGMRERAGYLGGRFEIAKGPQGRGARVTVTLPKSKPVAVKEEDLKSAI